MEIKRFSGNLLAAISECFDILDLLDEIEQNKNLNHLEKTRSQKYLVDLLVIKLHTLFEKRKDVISFERLLHEHCSKNKDFKENYSEIKKIFGGLIARITNNRKKAAHNPKNHNLGFSQEELSEFQNKTGIKPGDLPKIHENQYLMYRNLPRDGIIVLLQKLKHSLFYDVLYPQAKKIPIKELFK